MLVNNKKIFVLGLIVLLLLSVDGWSKAAKSSTPDPAVIDRVTHDFGNISTTIDNYGYIGGYTGLYPSGEWPRNSGHDYIAEIKYWMGAVLPSGDTVVVDTDEDFRPISSIVQEEDSYNIRLSTDSTTYNYNSADTIGLGIGNPAQGWRIYNADSSDWIYNKVYNTSDSSFYSGGPTALQQSFYRFEDGETPTSLGLQMTHTMCQWNYCYNEDLIFVIIEITNVSGVDYSDFAFGLYCDYDIGGANSDGGNGRLGDLVDSDSGENLAWTYDEDGYDPGWGPMVRTGIMGTKYLETPDDIGMTSFRTGQWDLLPDDDAGKFALINSDQYDTSLPPTDQYYIQCTKGIDLTAGKTVRVVFAIIAGKNEAEFYDNAATAQTLYDNNYVGPMPPQTPTLKARAGDNKVYLSWNDTAEAFVDPLSGEIDFRGYKLYKSTNRGYTWGFEDDDNENSCLDKDYFPLAAYQVETPGEAIAHTYIDSNLTNGKEYWYCLVAYDAGDSTVPIDPLQNGFGSPDANENVIRVTPRSDAAGSFSTQSTVKHTNSSGGELSSGTVYAHLFDSDEPLDNEYSVIFSEDDYSLFWHLIRIDDSTGDTTFVLEDQTELTADPSEYDLVEGLRVIVRNSEDQHPQLMAQTSFAAPGDTTLNLGYSYGTWGEANDWPVEYWAGNKHIRSTYEFRFTDSGSNAYSYWDWTAIPVPFEIWNTTSNQQVFCEIYDQGGDGIWNPEESDYILLVNWPYDDSPNGSVYPTHYVWFFRFASTDTSYATGDVFTVQGADVIGPDDVFTFKTDGISSSLASNGMDNIRAVPDPYIGRSTYETSMNERQMHFVNLPDECTIRIYTLGGDLVETLGHEAEDASGTKVWDMLSKDGLTIASGIYIYHVESKYGTYLGRFAVIM